MADRNEHLWTIDGIEEGMARVEEDGARMITVPVYLLPAGAREGQILRVVRAGGGGRGKDGVILTITIDDEATTQALAKSKATMASAMAASKKRDPGGNVSL